MAGSSNGDKIIKMIRKYFFKSETYKRRQLYVIMCGQVVIEDLELFHR